MTFGFSREWSEKQIAYVLKSGYPQIILFDFLFIALHRRLVFNRCSVYVANLCTCWDDFAKGRGWVVVPKQHQYPGKFRGSGKTQKHQFSGKFRGPKVPIFGKISWFRQNPKVPIFRKICHFRKFLNRQISGKIRGFVRNFRKIWDFWPNCRMYWSNSGYNCRVSDRGAHFFGRRSVLCNNIGLMYIYILFTYYSVKKIINY